MNNKFDVSGTFDDGRYSSPKSAFKKVDFPAFIVAITDTVKVLLDVLEETTMSVSTIDA